jgi:hypothetical protein
MPPRTAARSLLKGLKCYTPSFHSDPLLTNAAQCNRQCVARPRAGIILADNVTFAIEETSALAQQRPNHRGCIASLWTWISKPTEDRQAGWRNLLRLPCLPAPQKAHRAVFCAIKGNYRALRPATLCGLSVGRLVSDDGRSGRCGALWSPLARTLGSGGHPRGRKPVLRARGGKTAPPLDSPQECRLSECQGTEASDSRGMPHSVRRNGDTTTRNP